MNRTATYWPHSSGYNSIFSRSPGLLNRGLGSLGAQPLLGHGSHSSIFPNCLKFLSPGLYNNLTSIYFQQASQFALISTPRQSRSPLISWYLRPDAPVIYTGAFLLLTAWLGWRSICNRMEQQCPSFGFGRSYQAIKWPCVDLLLLKKGLSERIPMEYTSPEFSS